jgi:glycosyltransferase involved in cell wall biosynthesis
MCFGFRHSDFGFSSEGGEMLSVILPCRNQADHIGEVLPRYLAPLEEIGIPFELVVVPNASRDRTQEVVERLARGDNRIRVVPNPHGGWGLSVRTGLDAARGSILCYTNTARTDPALLPAFLACYQRRGPCLVKARRGDRKDLMRDVGSLLYNLEARLLFGVRCQDVNGTPKVFGGDWYRSLRPTATGDLLDLELMIAAAREGFSVIELPVTGFRRHGGKSSTTVVSAWKMYVGALGMWWNNACA